MAKPQEYLGIKVVHATPQENSIGPGYCVIYDMGTEREYISWSPADKFEESYIPVADGEGNPLRGVAALAILGAMRGDELPEPANEQPSNAELGKFTEEHIRGVARVCHNAIVAWQEYEGLLRRSDFDACPHSYQVQLMAKVENIAYGKPYEFDRSNRVEVFKDRLCRVIVQSILAD